MIQNYHTVPFQNNNSNSAYVYFNDHWTPETQNATYPRVTSSPYANNTQDSDFWMRNNSHLRLKTGTIGYTLPKNILNSLHIENVRIYFTGQNIFTLSKLKFMDPEMSYSNRTTAYPNMKSFVLGANITF